MARPARGYSAVVITGLQHMGLVVEDLEASRRFYGEILGMREVPRPSSFTFGGAWFRAGTDEIHLILKSDTTQLDPPQSAGAGFASGLATHLAFEVADFEAELRRLADLGVTPDAGPLRRGDGVVQAYLRDPDGYVVELFQMTGEDQSGTVREPVRVSS
jgi:catechol 2,3-dioxygenase-like lactoylglutathione lyase family enzyme